MKILFVKIAWVEFLSSDCQSNFPLLLTIDICNKNKHMPAEKRQLSLEQLISTRDCVVEEGHD